MRLAGIELPRMLADAARECRSHLVGAAIFSFGVNLLYLASPIYMLQVYDRAVPSGSVATLLFITLALAIALITLSSLDAIRLRLLVRASLKADALVAPQLLQRVVRSQAGATQSLRDFDTIRAAMASPAATALLDLPWLPVFILVSFFFDFWIGMLAVVSAVAMMALAWANQRSTRAQIELATTTLASAHNWTQSAAIQSEVVRALGMQSRIVKIGLGRRSTAITDLASAQFAGSKFTATGRFLRLFVQSVALGLGALLAIEGKISAGAIIASSIIVGRALQPIDALIAGWSSLMGARAALHRLADAIAADPGEEQVRTRLPAPEGAIDVDKVSARTADGRVVLQNVTLRISPGEALAVVGPSGAGKTTLSRILVGAIAPAEGSVRIDGAALTDWNNDELGRYVGYMPQQPSLLEGSVRDNICRFNDSVDREAVDAQVVAASKLAGIHDMILHLPKGYDTPLGPLGVGLSAGQAQRVALARALYGMPPVIVLDEPNSWLDSDGDAALAAAVRTMRARKSTIVIAAHRKTILDYCNRVLVLDGGQPRLLGETADVLAKLAGPRKSETAA